MALSLTINILNADINYSINKEDIELAQEVGLLNQTDDFENMITKEEEYFEYLDQFIYELEFNIRSYICNLLPSFNLVLFIRAFFAIFAALSYPT